MNFLQLLYLKQKFNKLVDLKFLNLDFKVKVDIV